MQDMAPHAAAEPHHFYVWVFHIARCAAKMFVLPELLVGQWADVHASAREALDFALVSSLAPRRSAATCAPHNSVQWRSS
jgi:hypothetical protein